MLYNLYKKNYKKIKYTLFYRNNYITSIVYILNFDINLHF